MAILIWDFDNTLAFRNGMWSKSLNDLLIKNGYNIGSEKLSKYLTSGFPWHRHEELHSEYFGDHSWWEYINNIGIHALTQNGILENEAKCIIGGWKNEYLRVSEWELYNDTICNLQKSIDEGHSNYILSNHTPELENLVQKLGISMYFEKVITSAHVGCEKPNIKIFEVLLDVIEDKEDAYMIGDSYNADISGALNFGIDAILVRKENTSNYHKYSNDLNGIWDYI